MHLPTDLSRRDWIKRFVIGTAASLSAPEWCATILAESTTDTPAVLRLKAADYAPLANPGGSIQFVFITDVHPFTLNRVSATRFVTLDSVCTHQGCVVGLFSPTATPPRMRCPCHGSRYDIEGRVFRTSSGVSTEPAQNDLKQFATTFDVESGVISITIPGLALAIRSITQLQQGQTSRVKLDFPVTAGAKYEVRRHSSLDGPFTVVPFAASAAGALNHSVLAPTADANVSVYVEASGPRGFYVIALQLLPY